MSFIKYIILLSAVFISSQTLNAATVYKWVDEDGQVHYGSKPATQNAEELKLKNKYIDSGNATAPLSAEERVKNEKRFLKALDAENKSISDSKRKKQEQDENKIVRCNASRDQLRRYENSSALYDLDEKGNRILLNKKQYEKAMAQAKSRVQKWCN